MSGSAWFFSGFCLTSRCAIFDIWMFLLFNIWMLFLDIAFEFFVKWRRLYFFFHFSWLFTAFALFFYVWLFDTFVIAFAFTFTLALLFEIKS
jgi:hypothetical protein